MSDWTSGYIADITYTYGYYNELSPVRVALAFLNAGIVPPSRGAVCELGFGQGLSINIHAAGQPDADFWGTDFNPSQAGHAQALATASGISAQLFDQAFDEFCCRDDLPEFDYIGLHGIWSWISDDNRHILVDFLRRKLKVGGVLYVSYNTQPGWAAMVPVRHLLTQHAEVMGVSGQGTVPRINASLIFAEQVLALSPIFVQANAGIDGRLKKLTSQDRHYLAHEYFNLDWHPMPFADMADWLKSAKLSYACSANYLEHVDVLNLTAEQQTFLKEIPDATFRETVRDFMLNQSFRKDYWVKGARTLSSLERAEALREQQLVLIIPRADVPTKIMGFLGEAQFSEAIYSPILDVLANHQAKSIGQIEIEVNGAVAFSQIVEAVMLMVYSGTLAATQRGDLIEKAKIHTNQLNMNLMKKSRHNNDYNFLASPVTGGGIVIGRFRQLFLLARSAGKQTPEEWAQFVWDILSSQGQKLIIEGKHLESPEENLAVLNKQANEFATKYLSIMLALGIAT